jgi:hypothetical protein
VREQGRRLEHEPDVADAGRQVGDVLVVEQDPAGRRLDEAGDHAQRRRLAAARRPEQGQELAIGDVDADVVDGCRRAEALRDRVEVDDRHQRSVTGCTCP